MSIDQLFDAAKTATGAVAITIRRPDDWHVHLRDGAMLKAGCAGIFGAATALQTYVQVFDEENALGRFESFASLNGVRFYGLKPNPGAIVLERQPRRAADDEVVVFRGGESLSCSIGEIRP